MLPGLLNCFYWGQVRKWISPDILPLDSIKSSFHYCWSFSKYSSEFLWTNIMPGLLIASNTPNRYNAVVDGHSERKESNIEKNSAFYHYLTRDCNILGR